MRNYLIYDGVSSEEFGAYVSSSNFLDGASRDVTMIQVPGKNGAFVQDNNRFNNFALVEKLYIIEDIFDNAHSLRGFLAGHSHGYFTLEESLTPEIFRMARFAGSFAVEVFDNLSGAFPIEFDCKPQRFLKTGTVEQTITSGTSIYNPTHFDARPLIRIYGNGTVTIGTQTVTVAGNTNSYVDVDCEAMDCFYGSTNLNSKVTLSGHEFPVLKEGANMITFTDISSVKITPRWWTI